MAQIGAPLIGTRSEAKKHIDLRRLQIACWAALIVIATVRAWLTRYLIHGDAVSYLDLSRMFAEGHKGAIVNALWSPGYPILLSFFLMVLHPNSYWESPLAHLANVVVFFGALACFQLFWAEVRLWHERYAEQNGAAISEPAFWIIGYSMFAIAILNVVTLSWVGPDLLVAAFCCLTGWAVLRFRRTPSLGHGLLLGSIAALGYYAKAPLFPTGLIFILCACIAKPGLRRMIVLGGAILTTYLLLCAPYIATISLSKGRLTFGDSARLNEAFYIDGVRHFQHWQGGPPGSGVPIHPTRQLNDFPAIYEFSAKNMGTYPPWFDPTYWYEGVTPHPEWKLQAKMFVVNLIKEFQIIMGLGGAVALSAAIVLALLGSDPRRWIRGFWKFWPMWLPAAIALSMFALVHVEARYLGGWLILLFAGAICACSQPADGSTGRAVRGVAVAVIIATAACLVSQASQEALDSDYAMGRNPSCAQIAEFLLNNGLHPGDPVAVIGAGFEGSYWAHLARLQVVSEIPTNYWPPEAHPALDFWESGAEQQQRALNILEQTGAKAVIAGSQTSTQGELPSVIPPPWKRIDGTWAAVYFFHANQ
jgi:hypothetical protein